MRRRFWKIVFLIIQYLGLFRILTFTKNDNANILFVLGMFRSGTSLTSKLLEQLGLPLNKDWRLLKAVGNLAILNPEGFREDFLFAQVSRFWFEKLNRSGDNPPTPEEVAKFKAQPIRLDEFINFSETVGRDNRISNLNRLRCYLLLLFVGDRAFVNNSKQIQIKIPMLTPFYEQLLRWYPNSKYLIVIRNPDATIVSSKKLTENSNIDLYNRYYIHLYNLFQKHRTITQIISYDDLLENSKLTIQGLKYKYNLQGQPASVIRKDLIRSPIKLESKNSYYDYLLKEAFNKNISEE